MLCSDFNTKDLEIFSTGLEDLRNELFRVLLGQHMPEDRSTTWDPSGSETTLDKLNNLEFALTLTWRDYHLRPHKSNRVTLGNATSVNLRLDGTWSCDAKGAKTLRTSCPRLQLRPPLPPLPLLSVRVPAPVLASSPDYVLSGDRNPSASPGPFPITFGSGTLYLKVRG